MNVVTARIVEEIGIKDQYLSNAYKKCYDVLLMNGLSSEANSIPQIVAEKIREGGRDSLPWDNINNALIEMMFEATKEIVQSRYRQKKVTWCVDNDKSRIYVTN